MDGILSKLDVYTRQWAMTLTEDDIAKLLQAVYKLPGLLETIKAPIIVKSEEPERILTLEKKLDYLATNTRNIVHLLTETGETSETPATIGKAGEDKFMKICRSLPVNYKVQDTSKQGKKGDFIITYSHMGTVKRCLVDIKNYTSTIPKKEVEKFFEDLNFGSYDAGLIISYNSKFVGIADHIYLEEPCLAYGKIPVMYLSTSDSLIISQAIELLIVKAIVKQSKDVNVDRIESLIEHINNALANSSDVRRLLSDLMGSISKSIQKCQESLVTHESHIKRALREMANCITKAMIEKVMPLVPVLEAREDNIDPNQPVTTSADLEPVDKNDRRVCAKDVALYDELLSLQWAEIDKRLESKYICELESKNMIVRIAALKNKTTVFIEFQTELTIPDEEFDGIVYKISKDNVFICQLNEYLVPFIKKYML